MNVLTSTVARWVFCLPFVVFGVMHLMNADAMAGMVPAYFPGGAVWIYISGLALVAGGLAIALQKMDRLASLLIALLLLIIILTMHVPGVMSGDQLSMSMLLKDTSMLGGALTYAGLADRK